MDGRRLARIAARHLGLFTRAEAAQCGYSRFQVRRRLGTGEWQQVCGPVLAFRGRGPVDNLWITHTCELSVA
jgi:hypothetical protein